MATLVLTAIGTLVGGPIGGAIGALAGQAADRQIFGMGSRAGPRLGDLSVQVSRYGEQLPKLFGTMRVSGSVIWATDLREESHRSGGGKSGPRVTTYSYSSSFAVALSSRPIRAVHRIWADGKLLRGAAGDWKSEVGAFRLHPGDEGQAADPLIQSTEGAASTPAHRGIAYAVFQDLQLADFGNRIPLLTFEVEADAGPVDVGMIAEILSDGAMTGNAGFALGGYAATGDSVRDAIDPIAQLLSIRIDDDGAGLGIADPGAAPVVIDPDELGASADTRRVVRRSIDQAASGTLPDEIAVSYYEPTRDFQLGLQRARRDSPARRSTQIDLPAALGADEAKGLAARRLRDAWAGRITAEAALPWRHLSLRPGMPIMIEGRPEHFVLSELTFEKMVAQARLVCVSGMGLPAGTAAPGRSTREADEAIGPTRFEILDLPPLDDALATVPRLWIAAAGPEAGWRGATFMASLDGGASFTAIGSSPAPAVMGNAVNMLGEGDPQVFDERNVLEVLLLDDRMTIEGRSDDALVNGANLAMLGDELIQFGRVEMLGPRRFRLSRLTRGRRGTEWAIASHAAGDRFVLIEAETLVGYDLPVGALGGTALVIGRGIGDDADGVSRSAPIGGAALRPPSPCKLTAQRLGDGAIRFTWVRRSRVGWAWLDGVDAPLGEDREQYQIGITPDAGSPRNLVSTEPSLDYTAAMQAGDGSSGAAIFTLSVAQIGSIALSRPVTATFSI